MEKVVKSTIEIDRDGVIWLAEWASFIRSDGTETSDRWLKISRKEADGSLTPIDDLFNYYRSSEERDEREAITGLLVAGRVKEIQAEYGIPSDDLDEVAITEQILARVWSGEWMGQLHDSYSFYIDNLAAIFGNDFLEASGLVRTLTLQGKAGLNGFIIVPWEEEEKAFNSWEETTGHKRLLMSDGHGWGCQSCGNNADERGPSPKEVPCVPQMGAS